MRKISSFIYILGIIVISSGSAIARNQINIVGSSTVYPFTTLVAENFALRSNYKTPKVESTGSGGGLKLFCEGIGINKPDITNSSRRIKQSEIDRCRENGVTDIIEVKIGYDGVVIANSRAAKQMSLQLKQLFLALAKDVPNPDGSETFVPNPYQKWSDIDASLPNQKIEVLGPPPTSGTRDAFSELAMEGGCKKFAWIKAMKKEDKKAYKARCHALREDGAYIESGENDNLIVQKLKANPVAFGIFGFGFLDQNRENVRGNSINGFIPEFERIANGDYSISRSLYFYVKKAHIGIIPGIKEYLTEFMADHASGMDGYLIDIGMIPMSEQERAQVTKAVMALESLPAKL